MMIVVAVLVVLVLLFFFRPHKTPTKGLNTGSSQPEVAPGLGHHWTNGGNFDFEVVGESHYQQHLAKLAGAHGERGAETECIAALVLENDNQFDSKAVAVRIGGSTVGYLSKDDARSYRRRVGAKKIGAKIATCNAIIRGGFMKNGSRASYGVWLDMKPFDE